MFNYFSLKEDADNFSKAGFLGKLGNGPLIETKIVANIGIFEGK